MDVLQLLVTNINFTIVIVAMFILFIALAITSAIARGTRRYEMYRHQEKLEQQRQEALKSNLIEDKNSKERMSPHDRIVRQGSGDEY